MKLVRLAAVGAACGLVVVSALAATNAVPASNAEEDVSPITVDGKKPIPTCNGVTVTVLITGGGGGGDDALRGDAGTDVCIGGPGTDSFHATCETQIQ